MTALAPGLDAPKTDGSCFNCGSHDHFAYACPEPVRKEPYGAAVFRQRQADKTMHGSGGRGSDTSRPKGGSIVVTKYAPPPSFPPPSYYPPPPSNGWGQGGPYPPPASGPPPSGYGQQPPQPYPPPNQAQPYPPPYPPANTGYVSPAPPPPPPPPPPSHANGGYGPPPPPASAPPYGQYGQYGQAPYQPPPPSSYAPPGSYPPSAYPASYAPTDRLYPPAPPQPSYQGPPPPGYQAPPIPPPPPPSFVPGYGAPSGPPPPGSYPPTPYPPNYQPPMPYTSLNPPPKPNWPQDSGGHNNQRNRDRRDRRNDRDRGNKNKQHRRDNNNNNNNNNNQRGRNHRDGNHRNDASSRRPSSTPRERSPKPGPAPTDAKIEVSEIEATKAEDAKTQEPAIVEDSISKEDQFDQDELWDFEKAFIELETKAADPVGKPLAAEWNDIPTIPPAYNAKCIKSEYYDPDNPDAFLASVRDTKHWPAMKRDPVLRFRRGMVVVQFPGSHHEYFTYHCSKRLGANELKERDIVPMPTDETLIDSTKARKSHSASVVQRYGDYPSISLNGKRSHPEVDDYNRDVKRSRNKELDRSPIPRLPRRISPRDAEIDAGPWAPLPGEPRGDSPQRPYSRDEYSQSPGGYRLQANGRLVPYDSAPPLRNDSGYHSSSDRHRSSRDDRSNAHVSPLSSVRVRERDASYDRDRDWDRPRERGRDRGRQERSRSRSLTRPRPHSRTHSPSRSRSRSRSRTAAPDSVAADSEDDMDDLEYELLGMQRPETPEKKTIYKPVMRRPRVKVNDAFSRRW